MIDRVQVVGSILQIEYRDENNARQTLDYLPSTGGSSNYYPIPDGDVGGTANAITLTTGQSLSAYVNGQMFFFSSNFANTGAVTVNVDGIGTRPVNRSSGQGSGEELVGVEITDRDPILLIYGTEFNSFYFIPGHIGTAAQRNVGDSEHQLPVLQSDDSLTAAHLAPGGNTGDLMIRTNTGKEWQTSDLDDLRVIATYADLPAPSSSTEGIFYYIESTKDIFITEPVTEYGVPQLGSFDVIIIDPTFLIYDIRPPADFTTSGQTAYAENRRHFYLCNTSAPYRWSQRTPTQTLNAYRSDNSFTVNFIGQYGSDAEALDHIPTINPNTDYFYIDVNGTQNYSGSLKRLDLSSFAAAVTPTVIYEWAFAVDHVRANPDGAPQATLEKLQLGHLIYDFDFGGSAVGLRDEFRIGDVGNVVNTTATPTQGNVYRVDSGAGIRLLQAACFINNPDSTAREYRVRVYRGTDLSGEIRFDALVHETDLIDVPGNSNEVLRSTIADPIEFANGELIYVSTVRIGADNQRGDARSSTTFDALSTFAALDTLGISFVGWTRRIDDDPWPDNDTENYFGTEVYRQHIRFDNSLIASDLDTYGGTIVVANPESPSTQPVLETVNIAGRTLRVQDRISDGDNVLEPTYTINLHGTDVDTSATEAGGNIYQVGARPIQMKNSRQWVNAAADANYRLDLVKLTAVSSTNMQVAEVFEGDTVAVLGNRTQQVAGTWGSGSITLDAESFFAIVAINLDTNEFARVEHATGVTEITTSAHGFEFFSRASSDDQNLAIGENIYRNLQNGARAEVVFEIEVARALQIEENGQHVITSPNAIDFREPFEVSLEAGVANLRVALRNAYVKTRGFNGVLYIVVDTGGNGYTGTPTVGFTGGGGGSGATAVAVVQGGSVTRIAVHERGVNYVSAPTVTFTGGGGSGATATAFAGHYSEVEQDFSNNRCQ